MFSSLQAPHAKLSKYYAMTDSIEGNLSAICTIQGPANKLQFFSTKEISVSVVGASTAFSVNACCNEQGSLSLLLE